MAMFSALRRHKDTALGISAGMIVLLAAIPSGATPCSAAEENAGQEAELEKVLRSVKRLRLFEYGATDLKSVAPHERPVHHYGDEERRLFDSTLWMWGDPDNGRPVAAMKLERYPENSYYGRRTILYGLVSLSSQRIRVEFPEDTPWTSARAGIELAGIPGSPEPAAAGRLRSLQARALSRRFTAHLLEAPGERMEKRTNLRLMPRPLYEYSGEEHGILYGALFGLANGTNPDVLLLIEARATDSGPRWQYGTARLTRTQILVQLDSRQVPTLPPPRSRRAKKPT